MNNISIGICSTSHLSPLDPGDNFHYVLDCSKDLMRDHCYWPFVSDLINVLSHKPVAYKFMVDERLLQLWFEITSCLQGMNSSTRWVSTYTKLITKINLNLRITKWYVSVFQV